MGMLLRRKRDKANMTTSADLNKSVEVETKKPLEEKEVKAKAKAKKEV